MENTVVRILRDVSVDGFTELLCSFLYNYKCAPTRVYLFLVLVSFRCAHWVGGGGTISISIFRSINSRRVSSMVIVGTKCLVGGSQMESLLVVSATIEVDNRVTACAIPIVKCSRTKVCKM